MKKFVKWVIKIFLCNIFYRVKYIDYDNIKDLKKCVICPNHSNTVEPTWLFAKDDSITIMAKAELFKKKFWAKIFTYFNVFPIHRGEHDIRSLIHAINLDRVPAKVGPVYIAIKADVPIVPVYITKNAKLFSRVKIIYGKPIYVKKELLKDKEALQNFTDTLMDNIYEMGNR